MPVDATTCGRLRQMDTPFNNKDPVLNELAELDQVKRWCGQFGAKSRKNISKNGNNFVKKEDRDKQRDNGHGSRIHH